MMWNIFTTREVALGCWFAIAIFMSFFKLELKNSLFQLIKCFFSPAILRCTLLLVLYFILITFLLNKLNLWNISLIKDSILWFFFAGLPIFSKVSMEEKYMLKIKEIFRELFKSTLIFEFVFNTYTFNFWVEFIMIPVVFGFGMMLAVSSDNKEYEKANKLLESTSGYIGLGIFCYCIYEIYIHLSSLISLQTARTILAPILYTYFLLIPAISYNVLYHYNAIFRRLGNPNIESKSKKNYLVLHLFLYAGFNTQKLEHVFSYLLEKDLNFKSFMQIHTFMKNLKIENEIKEFDDNCVGFDPKSAVNYLSEFGLSVDDYKYTVGGEEFGSFFGSSYLNNGTLNYMNYFMEGTNARVQKLKIEFGYDRRFTKNPTRDYSKFLECATCLLKECFKNDVQNIWIESIRKQKSKIFETEFYTIKFEKFVFPANKNLIEYRFFILVTNPIKVEECITQL